MPKQIAIVGGGIAGLAAAYELALQQQAGTDLTFTLYEATNRLGGIVDSTRIDGFVLEGGPDGWVSEKPWARDLAIELGLESELITSNDAERVTYILRDGKLLPMPDGMRMMVPTNLATLDNNPLFSEEARRHYREEPARAAELKATAPQQDETVANFVERHFGSEVLNVIGAPLLNGVFGGDVYKLSVQAVMQPFVKMEREHGSLILALQQRAPEHQGRKPQPIFTSLVHGVASLTEALIARLDSSTIRLRQAVRTIRRKNEKWRLAVEPTGFAHQDQLDEEIFDSILLCTPAHVTRGLLTPVDQAFAPLLDIPGSSAVTVAFALPADALVTWPRGFGFLVPESEGSRLLAVTFADQKFPERVPPGCRSIRAYFGGATADALLTESDEAIAGLARAELELILGPLLLASHTVVRRWPLALPQYHVGHLGRMDELDDCIAKLGNLHLLGNGYRGVGLPDLIRDARNTARSVACS